jgi:hypothetical protein
MTIADSETATETAVNQLNAIITRWEAFGIDQRVIDLANKYLGPSQANEMIGSARAGLVELDMQNALAALASTLKEI